jgi:predicted XRE-type DNA-binding protein
MHFTISRLRDRATADLNISNWVGQQELRQREVQTGKGSERGRNRNSEEVEKETKLNA